MYQVDIMGPRVDLVPCGDGQLTVGQKAQSTVSSVDIMITRSTGYIAGISTYIWQVGGNAVWPVDRVHWPVYRVHLAGRLGTLGLYPMTSSVLSYEGAPCVPGRHPG